MLVFLRLLRVLLFPPDSVLVNRPFIRSTTPFNSESVSALCRDKSAVYSILSHYLNGLNKRPVLRVPRTESIIDDGTIKVVKKPSFFLYPLQFGL